MFLDAYNTVYLIIKSVDYDTVPCPYYPSGGDKDASKNVQNDEDR